LELLLPLFKAKGQLIGYVALSFSWWLLNHFIYWPLAKLSAIQLLQSCQLSYFIHHQVPLGVIQIKLLQSFYVFVFQYILFKENIFRLPKDDNIIRIWNLNCHGELAESRHESWDYEMRDHATVRRLFLSCCKHQLVNWHSLPAYKWLFAIC
jgi:hypothetical protein